MTIIVHVSSPKVNKKAEGTLNEAYSKSACI